MLNVLYQAEQALPQLLKTTGWNSLLIDYHPPFVERLWRDWSNGYRISLHRIRTCEPTEALFHQHPWPSAIRIIAGTYEMGVGYTAGDEAPPIASKVIMPAGSAYEMVEAGGWHYVRPLTGITLSVMITGKPWSRVGLKSTKQLGPLESDIETELLQAFQSYYH